MSGDYELEDTVYLPFTTRAFSTGIPTVLVSGEVQVYEDASVTQITAAETLTVSLDSVVGFNMCSVAATSANGFEAGKSYTAILSAGTVDSVSAIGEVIGHFTIEASAAVAALATAQTDLDTLTGSDGATLATAQANYAPATAAALSTAQTDLDTLTGTDGATLATAQGNYAPATSAQATAIETDTQDLQTQIGTAGAGLTALPNQTMDITGNLSGSVGSVTGAVGSVTGNVGGVAGTLNTLDDLDTAQDSQHSTTQGKVDAVAADQKPKVNTALSDIPFYLVSSSDHVTPVTGKAGTATMERSIDGGAFSAGTGTLGEVSDGLYQYDASQADMNGAVIVFKLTDTGVDPALMQISTVD